MPIFKGDVVQLRALEPEDLDFIYQLENDPGVWRVSETTTPYSRFILRQYLMNGKQDIYEAKQLRLMIDVYEKDTFINTVGTIDIFDFDPFNGRAGLGILLSPEYRGQGYADETLKLIINYCFDFLQTHQLYCHIPANNAPSLKLFKSNGFQQAGILKEWLRDTDGYVDEFVFQLINPR